MLPLAANCCYALSAVSVGLVGQLLENGARRSRSQLTALFLRRPIVDRLWIRRMITCECAMISRDDGGPASRSSVQCPTRLTSEWTQWNILFMWRRLAWICAFRDVCRLPTDRIVVKPRDLSGFCAGKNSC